MFWHLEKNVRLAWDAFVRLNRRVIAMMFIRLSGMGVHCDQLSFSSSTWERGGVRTCKLGEELNANNENKKCIGEFNGCRLYTRLRLDYRLRLWAPTSASRAISVVSWVSCLFSAAVNMSLLSIWSQSNIKSQQECHWCSHRQKKYNLCRGQKGLKTQKHTS